MGYISIDKITQISKLAVDICVRSYKIKIVSKSRGEENYGMYNSSNRNKESKGNGIFK